MALIPCHGAGWFGMPQIKSGATRVPEFAGRVVLAWLGQFGVKALSIEPGSPREDSSVESFNSKLQDELLYRDSFETMPEDRALIERWRGHSNRVRPHSTLGYRPSAPETSAAGPPLRAAPGCSAATCTRTRTPI